jgi:ferredoxin-NADP reductase/ferredoxin
MELFNILQDLSKAATQLMQRSRMQRRDEGVDYTTDNYREQVKQAVARLHPKRMKLRLTNIVTETPTVQTFRFVRTDAKLPPWRAGQYINLYMTIDGVHTSRPYSISNPPGDPYLDLTVRVKPNGFGTDYLFNHVEVGQNFESSGPGGHFHYEPLIDRHGLVLIAGGSGITPIMSIIRHFSRTGWPVPMHLIYGSRTLEDTIYRNELDALSSGNPNLNYALVLSEPEPHYQGVRGFITADLISAHIGAQDLERYTVMVCGPNPMYDFVTGELKTLAVPDHHVRRELYGPPAPAHLAPGWPKGVKPDREVTIEVLGRGSFLANTTEPLINALERHGLKVRSMCRSGACSYCRVKLLAGEVYMPPQTKLREADRKAGYIHSCVSYAISDIRIQL